jgi:hypothetical protein
MRSLGSGRRQKSANAHTEPTPLSPVRTHDASESSEHRNLRYFAEVLGHAVQVVTDDAPARLCFQAAAAIDGLPDDRTEPSLYSTPKNWVTTEHNRWHLFNKLFSRHGAMIEDIGPENLLPSDLYDHDVLSWDYFHSGVNLGVWEISGGAFCYNVERKGVLHQCCVVKIQRQLVL